MVNNRGKCYLSPLTAPTLFRVKPCYCHAALVKISIAPGMKVAHWTFYGNKKFINDIYYNPTTTKNKSLRVYAFELLGSV